MQQERSLLNDWNPIDWNLLTLCMLGNLLAFCCPLFCFCLFDLILYVPVNNFSVMLGQVFLGWTSTKQGYVSCSRTQLYDAGEARTRGPYVTSQALYHWPTVLPLLFLCWYSLLSGIPWRWNSLDPGQSWHLVEPDLGPNCLWSLSA